MKKIIFLLTFLLLCGLAEAKIALDPSVIGVGARALGMGRAYVAITAEPDSVFLNPASLAGLSQWGLTSMYSKLINEVDYILLGWAYPTNYGAFGLGYLGASIGGIQNAVVDPNTGRISFEAGTVNYFNNIIYLSYGYPVYNNLSVGSNFKLYSQGFSGGNTGSGYDADVGLSYKPIESVTLGLLQRNLLPSSAGAMIKWSSGAEESLATTTRLGVNYSQGLSNLSVDYEFYPTRSGPGLLKLGGEWWIIPTFAVRIGSDQDPLETNLTAGLSYLFAGYQFDYAYHQYGALSANNTHAFSFSYGVFRQPVEKIKEYVSVTQPQDKTTLFADTVKIEGTVNPKVQALKINGQAVALGQAGAFSYSQPLALGKNGLNLSAADAQGKTLEDKKIRILNLKTFKDVPAAYWVKAPISILAMQNVITGYPDGTFRPEGNITRAEICSLLMKTKGEKTPNLELSIFKDVPAKHWAANYIAQAVAQGVVKGYPDGKFKPNGLITRAEGVATIARFSALPEPTVLEAPFPDVPGRFWAIKEILAAKQAGILKYLEGKSFEPNKQLTRAEVVEMLSNSPALSPKVKEVLDFEKGY